VAYMANWDLYRVLSHSAPKFSASTPEFLRRAAGAIASGLEHFIKLLALVGSSIDWDDVKGCTTPLDASGFEPMGSIAPRLLASLRSFAFADTTPAQWAALAQTASDARFSRTSPAASTLMSLGPHWASLLHLHVAPVLRALGVDVYCPTTTTGLTALTDAVQSVSLAEGADFNPAFVDAVFLSALQNVGTRAKLILADTGSSPALIPFYIQGDDAERVISQALSLAEEARFARQRQRAGMGSSASRLAAPSGAAAAAPTRAAAAAQATAPTTKTAPTRTTTATPASSPSLTPAKGTGGFVPFAASTTTYQSGGNVFKRPELEAAIKALNPALASPSAYNVAWLLLGTGNEAKRNKLVDPSCPGPCILPCPDWFTAKRAKPFLDVAASPNISPYFQ